MPLRGGHLSQTLDRLGRRNLLNVEEPECITVMKSAPSRSCGTNSVAASVEERADKRVVFVDPRRVPWLRGDVQDLSDHRSVSKTARLIG